ncbi:hypothetical protein [Liquorilactobacillus hordei]|uniref:Integral membrane protein n=1 Tax=Liquorilactobacillus hordei DSM 19519 TaxID=1423759 RepID=A0A0R1MJS0_9LACO|nr:hypothetical protein [Liquorilactobacillus hordei]KRL08174.1 hypothetical protein FC92_GL000689 [Liquorilactobacillus hordei DSM 19519]QYH51749.1 hypothetical protein G6O70_04380 [Liquorilactobacillus hordei DSM 19519]
MSGKDKRVKEIRNKLNELEKELKGTNATFFEDLRGYLITSSLFYEELDVTEQTYNVCVDLIEAQENGQTAQEYFGKDSRKLADSMIKNFKHASYREVIELILLPVGIYWAITFISNFATKGALKINILEYLLIALLSVGMIVIVFEAVHKSIYLSENNLLRKSKVIQFIIGTIFFSCIIGTFVAISVFTPPVWIVKFLYPSDVILMLTIIAIFLGWIIIGKKRELYSITPFIILMAAVGIAQRIPAVLTIVGANNIKFLAVGAAIIGFLINIVWGRILIKKMARK